MRPLKGLVSALLMVWAGGSMACSKSDESLALATAANHKSWLSLQKDFVRFGRCDDGAIAEGFTESVTTILANRWGDTTVLAEIGNKDSAFLSFVIRHIDASAGSDRLRRIAFLSEKKCHPFQESICRAIHQAATNAL